MEERRMYRWVQEVYEIDRSRVYLLGRMLVVLALARWLESQAWMGNDDQQKRSLIQQGFWKSQEMIATEQVASEVGGKGGKSEFGAQLKVVREMCAPRMYPGDLGVKRLSRQHGVKTWKVSQLQELLMTKVDFDEMLTGEAGKR